VWKERKVKKKERRIKNKKKKNCVTAGTLDPAPKYANRASEDQVPCTWMAWKDRPAE
jgi:hypothetical protein